MYQAHAIIWNQIAEQQTLLTDWAKQMFPLPEDQMALALEREERRLLDEGVGAAVVGAYLKVMPLLWEKVAISNFLKDNPEIGGAIPPIETASEAVLMAARDFSLTIPMKKRLLALLKIEPH